MLDGKLNACGPFDASRRGKKVLNPSRDENARRVPYVVGGGGVEEHAIM